MSNYPILVIHGVSWEECSPLTQSKLHLFALKSFFFFFFFFGGGGGGGVGGCPIYAFLVVLHVIPIYISFFPPIHLI